MKVYTKADTSKRETRLLQEIFAASERSIRSEEIDIYWDEEVASTPSANHSFWYINNPNGTLRWIFPKSNKYPTHLALFNSAHLKARLYKLATHLAFKTGLKKRLMSGSFTVNAKNQLPFFDLINQIPHDSYAVFTGTIGENRKSVVALNKKSRTTHFIKIAHTETAQELLRNEIQTLDFLASKHMPALDIPKLHSASTPSAVILSNIKPKDGRENARLEALHVRALLDLYESTRQRRVMADLPCFQEINVNLRKLERAMPLDESLSLDQLERMIGLLNQLKAQIDDRLIVHTSLAHGDFTPWNMYLSERKLHVYDWELAKERIPLLYDLFHFIYQSGILLIKQDFGAIHREIQRALRLPGMQNYLKRRNIDPDLYHQIYLLHLITYYLNIYTRQPKLHMQVQWLLKIWEAALKHVLSGQKIIYQDQKIK